MCYMTKGCSFIGGRVFILKLHYSYSKICQENGIKFIGASPQMIDSMGDKASAKETMKKAGVPTIPGSEGIIDTFEKCKKIA